MSSIINNFLGHTSTYGCADRAGFIQKHTLPVALFALITPILVESAVICVRLKTEGIPSLKDARDWVKIEFAPRRLLKGAAIVTPMIITAIVIGILAATHMITEKRLGKFELKTEIAPVIYPAYIAIALVHFLSAIYFARKDPLKGGKHAIGTYFATGSPIAMLAGTYDVRWHHMSYGLLCLMPRLRALNFFGFLMSLDSSLYWYFPKRDEYDFSNVFVKYLPFFITQVVLLSTIQLVVKGIFDQKAKEPESNYINIQLADI